MRTITLIFTFLMVYTVGYGQGEETKQQKQMAEQMAKYMDMAWEQSPASGMANIRLQFFKDNEVFEGTPSVFGKFKLKIEGITSQLMSFNPNKNGKYVVEEIKPGTYNLIIDGQEDFEGFHWQTENTELKAGEAPVFKIELP